MKKLFRFVAIILFPAFIACENQDTDSTTLKLSFKALNESINLSKTANESSGEGFGIDTAVIILERIKLSGVETGTNEILLSGPYEIDLLIRKSTPDLPVMGINPGTYTTLLAELYVPLNRKFSIYVSGTYTRDDRWWRFRYTYSQTGKFIVENNPGFIINENTSNNIWVIIDVIALFSGVNFRNAAVDRDNIIRINSTSNKLLAEIIKNNFAGATIIDDNEASVPKKIIDNNDDDGEDGDDDDDGEDGDDEGDDDDGDDGDDDGDDDGAVTDNNKYKADKYKTDKNKDKNKNNKDRGKKKKHNNG